MLRSRRAAATALFLVAVMSASIAVYLINSEVVHERVIVRGVSGTLEGKSNGTLSLALSYPYTMDGLVFVKQGQSFNVDIVFRGNGTR